MKRNYFAHQIPNLTFFNGILTIFHFISHFYISLCLFISHLVLANRQTDAKCFKKYRIFEQESQLYLNITF